MKNILLPFLFFAGFSLAQGPVLSIKTQNDVHKIQTLSTQILKGEPEILDLYPIFKLNGEYYVSFLAKLAENEDVSNSEGIFYGQPIGSFVSVRIRLDKLATIANLTNLQNLELAGKIKPTLDRVVFDTRVDSVHAGYGLPEAYTGKDVFIGITDWGFDYSSPMFYDTAMQYTRIYAAWDQFKTSGPAPAPYTYGTVYTTPAEFIAAGADTANIYSYATHGSHVAGIAGGGGAGIQYRGMAIESKFLFTTFLVDEAAVFDAWQWMFDIANNQGKRLVMNMSWGLYHFGTNDGNSILSQVVSSMTDNGVVFVTSGGNNGDVNFHIKKDFNNDSIASRVNFYSYASNPYMWGQSLHAWGEVGEAFEMKLQMLNSSNTLLNETIYFPSGMNAYVDTFMVSGTDTVWYNIAAEAAHPLNGRPTARFRVKNTNTAIKIIMKAQAASGRVHFWNVTELTTDVGNWGMPFTPNGSNTVAGDRYYGIGEPAASDDCITVAAHASNYLTPGGNLAGGSRAVFSSIGPRYDEVLKPDISAPGLGVRSSISSYTDNSFTTITSVNFQGRTYPFAAFSGTSMSSPAVAGICALILDANPYLSPQQVKQIILETARLDNYTGPIGPEGDSAWGHGKVNAYAAIQMALQTVGFVEVTADVSWSVSPNPSYNLLKINGLDDLELIQEVQIIDAFGRIESITPNNGILDVSSISTGTYLLRLVSNGKVMQIRFVKL